MAEAISPVDLVQEDSDLSPQEKETNIRFDKRDDRATVFTAESGLMRRLLQHPEFTVGHVVTDGRAKVENVERLDATDTQIVGLKGTIPIGCVKIRSTARASSGHAGVVSYNG